MKKLMIAVLALSVAAPVAAQNYVRGHYRSDGTYVQPHYRSSPDSSRFNNWSTQGNVNPYNGRRGTVDPYGYQSRRSSYGNGGIYGSYGDSDD